MKKHTPADYGISAALAGLMALALSACSGPGSPGWKAIDEVVEKYGRPPASTSEADRAQFEADLSECRREALLFNEQHGMGLLMPFEARRIIRECMVVYGHSPKETGRE